MTTLQIRIEDDMKIQATAICSELGIDLSTLVRMCLKKTIQEGGIPFEMKVSDTTRKGISAINSMRQKAEEAGLSDMTLDEINEEIRLARLAKEKR